MKYEPNCWVLVRGLIAVAIGPPRVPKGHDGEREPLGVWCIPKGVRWYWLVLGGNGRVLG